MIACPRDIQRIPSRTRSSRRVGWGPLCLLLTSGLLLVTAGAAAGASGRAFLVSLRQAPAGRSLTEPTALAIDHATGDLFVADRARGLIDVLGSAGNFLTSFGRFVEANGIAVDEASGDVYLSEPFEDAVLEYKPDGTGGYSLLSKWSGSGTPSGRFGEVSGVAVDNSTSTADPSAGDVYVLDGEDPLSERGAVDVFKASPAGPQEAQEGDFLRNLGAQKGVKLEEPNAIAVSAATGGVYVADSIQGEVDVFSSQGLPEAKINGSGSPLGTFGGGRAEGNIVHPGNVTALAVDETNGDLLVSEQERDVVSELNGAGEWVGWVTGTATGPFGEVDGVAAGASGDLYLADTEGALDTFGPALVVPDVAIKTPSKVTGTSAILRGTIDGDGEPAQYHFELGESEAYAGLGTPVQETTGAGEEKVQAALSGLKPATRYFFRLTAHNRNGASCSVGSWFTTEGGEGAGQAVSLSCEPPPASIEAQSASEVSSSEATLHTLIDPQGRDTTYQFQYGTTACKASPGSCTELPAKPGDLGNGEAPVTATVQLEGLKAQTTYFYRVLATNARGESEGIERSFTTRAAAPAFALPDGRSWEMVTPPDKHGAPVEALTREGGWILASESGSALAYVADGALTEEAQSNRSPEAQQVLAIRSPGGWSSQDIATPQSAAQGADLGGAAEYQFFTPDLSLALVDPYASRVAETRAEPPLAPGITQGTMYLRDDPPLQPDAAEHTSYDAAAENGGRQDYPGYLPLLTEGDEGDVTSDAVFGNETKFQDATSDLSHVVIKSPVALTAPSTAVPAPGPGLYEWAGGGLQDVSVLPGGEQAPEAALGFYHAQANAISSDGTRVIWTAGEGEGGAHLYMRDTATGQTIQLDKPEEGIAEEPSGAAIFQTSSTDGSHVFFADAQKLTKDSTALPHAGAPGEGDEDLYECEIIETPGGPTCDLHDLTAEVLRTGEHAAVRGFVFGASEDATSLYLVATGVLAAGENGAGETAAPGKDNLYRLHDAAGSWSTTFIATLSGEDFPDWRGGGARSDSAQQTARVSPDGEYVAFMSNRSLTGYDNEDVSSPHLGKRMDEEVFLYDAHTANLTCVSCDPSGARPKGVFDEYLGGEGIGLLVDRHSVWNERWLAGSIPGWTPQSVQTAIYQSRYLSDNGRLFFDDADAILANVSTPTRSEQVEGQQQQVGVENVYEYEPAGGGSCSGASGGCVSLLSGGASPDESAFLEASPEGENVFFLTAQQLLPQDTDSAFDIYDARVCTPGSPCLTQPPPAPQGCSEADACRLASAPVQIPGGEAGSATYTGPGNLPAPPAKHEVKGTKTIVKPPTRVQELAKTLVACRHEHPHFSKERKSCETLARKRYGPIAKKGARKAQRPTAVTLLPKGGHR